MIEACHHTASRDDRTDTVRGIVDVLSGSYEVPAWTPSGKPVDELIMTILSQHTSDTNTDRGYRALRRSFPTWREARDADPVELADSIRSTGLADRKAPRIQSALRAVVRDGDPDPNETLLSELRAMEIEQAKQRLMALNGVGPKTAACVLLFAGGMPALPVDTHVFRVSRRLGLIENGISAEGAHDCLDAIVPSELVFDFHTLLIQHGRRVCRARNPRCSDCQLAGSCQYAAAGANQQSRHERDEADHRSGLVR